MNALTTRAENSIKELSEVFAAYPTPDKWTAEMKAQTVQFAALMKNAQKVIAAAEIGGMDYGAKKETFLSYARSEHTRRAYASALDRLEVWTGRNGINPLELSAADADRFIHDMKAEGKAAATTRRNIAAISAFYSFLERETDSKVKNPIRGTKQRPAKENKKDTVIPTPDDYKTIIAALPSTEKALVSCLSLRGLRAGALPTLELKAGKYHGKSKGKVLTENNTPGITLPPEALKAIRAAGLDVKKPFAWINANAIERRINYHIGKLYQAEKIHAPYSAHDFRHFFAVEQYKKRKDIYRLSMLLNHANIAITQVYLKSLDVKL